MNFYKLVESGKSFVDYGMGNDWEGIVCPLNEGHQRAGKRITPLRLKVTSPRIVDFSWTFFADMAITDRAYQILKREDFTGFDAKPAEVVSIPKKFDASQVPQLWELRTTSKARVSASAGIHVIERCDACGLVRYSAYEHGLTVDDSTWDGSDFFGLVEWGGRFVTERVRDCLIEHALSNVSFVRVEDVQWPEGVVKPR